MVFGGSINIGEGNSSIFWCRTCSSLTTGFLAGSVVEAGGGGGGWELVTAGGNDAEEEEDAEMEGAMV
jgi:hypothetical protein